jgi:hypothetical protein
MPGVLENHHALTSLADWSLTWLIASFADEPL